MLNPRVVAGRDGGATELFGVLAQLAKLQPIVATHAGIGRAARVVLLFEVGNDATEVVAKIHDVEGDIKFGRDQARVRGVVD